MEEFRAYNGFIPQYTAMQLQLAYLARKQPVVKQAIDVRNPLVWCKGPVAALTPFGPSARFSNCVPLSRASRKSKRTRRASTLTH